MTLAQDATIKINDIELFYRTVGDGPPLLLLHGFFSSSARWEAYLSDLAEDFRLIVPDLRGHGRSTNPSGEFTHRQAAFDIYALLDKLEIRDFRAVGFSSGGMTLVHMATQQPDRIEALSLWAATNYFGNECRTLQSKVSFETTAKDNPAWLSQLRGIHAGGDSQISQLIRQFNKMAVTYDDMNFTAAYLSTIKAPTLIVHGDRDEFFPVHIAVDMYQAIPNASLWILPNVTHDLIAGLDRFSTGDGLTGSQKPFPAVVRAFLKEAKA